MRRAVEAGLDGLRHVGWLERWEALQMMREHIWCATTCSTLNVLRMIVCQNSARVRSEVGGQAGERAYSGGFLYLEASCGL